MIKNDEEKISEIGDSTRATSIKSKINNVYLKSFHLREQSKTYDCISSTTIIFLIDCLISLNVVVF